METWENFDVVLAANFLICFVNFNTKSKPTRPNLPFEENSIIINTWKLRSFNKKGHTNSIDVSDKAQNVWSPTQAKKFGAQTIIGVQREIGSLLKLSAFYVKISLRGGRVHNENL